ncbi:MAG: serine hydrolase [Micromonosporaceae bacterium]
MTGSLAALEPEFAAVGGVVSVWCGPVGGPAAYARLADVAHYPASTMKLAVLVAAYRMADAGALDLDAETPVHNDFTSAAPDGPGFTMDPDYDSDSEVWAKLGHTATLRWLARRMIIMSSNLATNLVLERTGYPAATEAWRLAGAEHSVVIRGIEDYAARGSGRDNLVTASDLAALLSAIEKERIASGDACREMREVLLAQEKNDDLPSGLPAGTAIGHKSGWVDGIRHDAGVVYPPDAPPYVVAVCTTTDRPETETMRLIGTVAAASWQDRHTIGAAPPAAAR